MVFATISGCSEFIAVLTSAMIGRIAFAPLLSIKYIRMFLGLEHDFDISKARNELGYNPKTPLEDVKYAMQYLMIEHKQFGIKIN